MREAMNDSRISTATTNHGEEPVPLISSNDDLRLLYIISRYSKPHFEASEGGQDDGGVGIRWVPLAVILYEAILEGLLRYNFTPTPVTVCDLAKDRTVWMNVSGDAVHAIEMFVRLNLVDRVKARARVGLAPSVMYQITVSGLAVVAEIPKGDRLEVDGFIGKTEKTLMSPRFDSRGFFLVHRNPTELTRSGVTDIQPVSYVTSAWLPAPQFPVASFRSATNSEQAHLAAAVSKVRPNPNTTTTLSNVSILLSQFLPLSPLQFHLLQHRASALDRRRGALFGARNDPHPLHVGLSDPATDAHAFSIRSVDLESSVTVEAELWRKLDAGGGGRSRGAEEEDGGSLSKGGAEEEEERGLDLDATKLQGSSQPQFMRAKQNERTPAITQVDCLAVHVRAKGHVTAGVGVAATDGYISANMPCIALSRLQNHLTASASSALNALVPPPGHEARSSAASGASASGSDAAGPDHVASRGGSLGAGQGCLAQREGVRGVWRALFLADAIDPPVGKQPLTAEGPECKAAMAELLGGLKGVYKWGDGVYFFDGMRGSCAVGEELRRGKVLRLLAAHAELEGLGASAAKVHDEAMIIAGRLLRLREVVVRSGGRDDKGVEVWEGLGATGQGLGQLSDMQESLAAAIQAFSEEELAGDALAHKVYSALAIRPRREEVRQRAAAIGALLTLLWGDHHAVAALATAMPATSSIARARALLDATRPLPETAGLRERKAGMWRTVGLAGGATVTLALLDLLGGTWWSGRLRHSLGDYHHAGADGEVSRGWDFPPLTALNVVPFALFGVLCAVLYAVKVAASRWLKGAGEAAGQRRMGAREAVRWAIDVEGLERWVAAQAQGAARVLQREDGGRGLRSVRFRVRGGRWRGPKPLLRLSYDPVDAVLVEASFDTRSNKARLRGMPAPGGVHEGSDLMRSLKAELAAAQVLREGAPSGGDPGPTGEAGQHRRGNAAEGPGLDHPDSDAGSDSEALSGSRSGSLPASTGPTSEEVEG